MNADSHLVRERLAREPSRGLGCAADVALEAGEDRQVLAELVEALEDSRAVVVSRAANALKKVQAMDRRALDGFARRLVRKALSCEVVEGRWNLTIVVGGLRLQGKERALAVELLFESLTSGSALQRVFALQALVDLSVEDAGLRRRLRPVVNEFLENGTAAMRARARKLKPLVDGGRS